MAATIILILTIFESYTHLLRLVVLPQPKNVCSPEQDLRLACSSLFLASVMVSVRKYLWSK